MTALTWQENAACRDADPDLFFVDGIPGRGPQPITQALAVCRRCPVREPCLTDALSDPLRYGIWGGTTQTARQRLRAAR